MLNLTRINGHKQPTHRVIIIHKLPSAESWSVQPVDRATGPKAEISSKITPSC